MEAGLPSLNVGSPGSVLICRYLGCPTQVLTPSEDGVRSPRPLQTLLWTAIRFGQPGPQVSALVLTCHPRKTLSPTNHLRAAATGWRVSSILRDPWAAQVVASVALYHAQLLYTFWARTGSTNPCVKSAFLLIAISGAPCSR